MGVRESKVLDGFVIPSAEDASDEKLIADVGTHGLHVVGVFDDREPGDNAPLDFSYSVGLYASYDQPEVLLMGLGFERSRTIINSVGEFVKSGESIECDRAYDDFLDGLNIFFRPINKENYREYLGYALWFYQSLKQRPFPAVQLVWPNREGLFPWDQGCSKEYQDMQVRLWEPAN